MKTVLNIKTDKSLKLQAQKVAEEFGIPLGTIMNAFLRQFIRSKEISLDLSPRPSVYLQRIIEESQKDLAQGDSFGPYTGEQFIQELKKL
jgi:addiction module RelB/DinJ family antitoxin